MNVLEWGEVWQNSQKDYSTPGTYSQIPTIAIMANMSHQENVQTESDLR